MPKFKRPNSYTSPKSNQNRTGESKFATQAEANAGTAPDVMISPATLDAAVDALIAPASTLVAGKIRIATDLEAVTGVSTTLAMTPHTVGLIAIAGAPLASEGLAGIAELATQAETNAGIDDARIVTPLKLTTLLTVPPAIGGTTPAAGAFTNLSATAVGTGNIFTSDTASSMSVTGALADLTLDSSAGRVIINGEEAAANAITLLSAAGGLDVNTALQINIDSSQVAATAVVISASGGGIDVTAAANDIDITSTLASINLTANEAAADAVVIAATAGGIALNATGAAGLDISLTNTGGSVNITATENAADAIVLSSTAGGIDIGCTGTAGEDIDITSTGSSINLTATEDAANAIYLHANGGVSETLQIRADQGTGVASINIVSDVGGVTINGGVASADAINITCGNAAGGIDVDAGTAGFIVDTTGGISLDATAASNFTATGAFDITVSSTAGSINISGGEAAADALNIDAAAGGLDVNVALQMNLDSAQAAADAIRVISSNAAGGIDVDAGTGGIAVDTTGAISIDSVASSNVTVTGAAADLTLSSVGGSVNIAATQAAIDAITVNASAGGIDITAATNDIDIVATLGSVNITANEAAADAVVISSVGGGMDITAGVNDLDIVATLASINITANEDAADALVITSAAGGIDIAAVGAAGQDIDISNTGGSINVTATENVSSAIVVNASGAASGISIDAGTAGITIGTGMILPITPVASAASPYAALGTDYFISTDTTGGVLTITLPAAPETGRRYIVADGTGQAAIGGNITVNGNGKNISFAGASGATAVLNTAYESGIFTYNGTLWIGQDIV